MYSTEPIRRYHPRIRYHYRVRPNATAFRVVGGCSWIVWPLYRRASEEPDLLDARPLLVDAVDRIARQALKWKRHGIPRDRSRDD